MSENIYDFVLYRLKKNQGRLAQISRESGVKYSTVFRIAREETTNPGVQHVQKLYDYFNSDEYV